MAELEYSISELHGLLEVGLRNSMSFNPNSSMYDDAVANRDSIIEKGNPINNKLYKQMKLPALVKHMNYAGGDIKRNSWDNNIKQYDYIIDDGQIESVDNKGWHEYNKPKVLSQYSTRSNLNKYQPYFEPTGRISDFAVAHSTGIVGLKFGSKVNQGVAVAYGDYYNDKDMNCVTVIVDVGKNSNVDIEEEFFNKNGLKVYRIVYLLRPYTNFNLNRKFDITNKDVGANIVDSTVIQFPGSSFNYTVQGEGSKYTQDIMHIDIYDSCKTNVTGLFDIYDDNINNTLVDVHHKGPGSESRVNIKSIVDDNSHSSFLGSITVDKEAIDTDAQLVNKNLLLSSNATAITEPQLDIHTKEIACSHGCTVSNIDKEQLYFLESRGIETHMAEETLKQCFLMA